jgi:O-methyltransferase involved in polyketide biosynthesis
LVVLGAGYDVIATRLLNQGVVQEAYELDLPQVVQRKQLLLDRLQKRRRIRNERQTAGNNHEVKLPQLVGVDFNDISSLRKELQLIGSSIADREYTNVHTIFWSEGVMIYLNATIPGQLLQACADSVDNNSASLIFADRLENVPGGDLSLAKQELLSNQWELIDWCPKPGLARHMGRARLVHVR